MKWHHARKQQERWNYLKGGVTLSLSLFLFLSFFSYSPQDPSFNSFGLSLKMSNYCGYVGAFLSDLFFQLFGLMSWGLVPGLLFLSFQFFKNTPKKQILSRLLFFFLFLSASSCLLNLHLPEVFFYKESISLGGAFATLILKGITPFFHTAGTSLILWSFLLLSFFIYGQKTFIQFLIVAQKTTLKTSSFVFLFSRQFIWWLLKKSQQILEKDWGYFFGKIETFFSQRQEKKKGQKTLEEKKSDPPQSEKKKIEFSFPYKDQKVSLDPAPSQKPELEERQEATEQDEGVLIDVHSEKKEDNKRVKFTFKEMPALDLLNEPPSFSKKMSRSEVEILSKKLTDKLAQFSIDGKVTAIKTGPAVIMFEFKPGENVKVSRIKEMANDLSLALSSESVRIIAPIPGRDVVGIEASSPYREMVYLKNMLKEEDFSKSSLPLVLGRRSDNAICIRDLAKIPHLLIAGTTGSGKSVFVISFITSLLFRHTPDNLRLILVDPKQVDLSAFNEIPHLLSPIITSSPKAVMALKWAIVEMEKRYRSLAQFGARDKKSFNEAVKKMSPRDKAKHKEWNEECPPHQSYYYEPLPFICIVVEEFGDLMADPQVRKGIESSVVRLAQKARASGIHLVLAMQSPRKDVVTGLIKTNIPGRISFKVASGIDSRIILDEVGAEGLLSHGDMLFLEPGTPKSLRYHGPFVSEKEVSKVVKHWKEKGSTMYEQALVSDPKAGEGSFSAFPDSTESDPMYDEILSFVQSCDVISASYLQRKFRIGYPRAARLIESLFDAGVIGPAQGGKPREVLANK